MNSPTKSPCPDGTVLTVGKGDETRVSDWKRFRENYEKIFGKKEK